MKNILYFILFAGVFALFMNSIKIYNYLSGNTEKEEIKKSIEIAELEINKNNSYKNYFCDEEYSLKELCHSTFPYVSSGEKVCDNENFTENLFFKEEFNKMSQGFEKSPDSCSVLKSKYDKEIQRLEKDIILLKEKL